MRYLIVTAVKRQPVVVGLALAGLLYAALAALG